MKMKCIGGLANGEIIEVESYLREDDLVRVRAKVEFYVIDFLNANKMPDVAEEPFYYYKVATLHFLNKTKLNFLIPEKMNAEDTLCFVLGA